MMQNGDSVPSFQRSRVAENVTAYLRDQILTGRMKAGEHIRVERLAGEVSLSVTPVRESLLELLAEGYVERFPNRGYVVSEITRAGLEEQVLTLAMITGELAARAAERIDDEQLGELTRLQKELRSAQKAGSHERADEVNHAFHSLINKTADSPRLAWLAQRNSHYVPRSSFASLQTPPAVCNYEHKEVLRALNGRDPEAARKAMADHLVASGRILADLLADNGFWSGE